MGMKVGDIVRSTKCPAWGRGKVVALDGGKIYVVFENESGDRAKRLNSGLEVLPNEAVPMLDHLPPRKKQGSDYVFDVARASLSDLISQFIRFFPGRFDDPEYMGRGGANGTGERVYKVEAHQTFVEGFGHGRAEQMLRARDGRGVAAALGSVIHKQNLLSTQEQIALLDAFKSPDAALGYGAALFSYLATPPSEESFRSYAAAVEALPKVGQFRVATWPVATLFPYLAQPDRHMFLRPDVTKKAAAIMGFDLLYRPEVNWVTYSRLVRLSEHLMTVLRPLGARDMIDVQSFIWVALKYP